MVAFSITYEMLFFASILAMFACLIPMLLTNDNKKLCIGGIGIFVFLFIAIGFATLDQNQAELEAKQDYDNYNVDPVKFMEDGTYQSNVLDLYVADMMCDTDAKLSDRFGGNNEIKK